ncbi:hypothetical protein FPQ18DRAFT_417304 [Pyronema domesticum]|nr:hypothetical protein FPQ18DRAFT_417304 [Pyronema domesticum]
MPLTQLGQELEWRRKHKDVKQHNSKNSNKSLFLPNSSPLKPLAYRRNIRKPDDVETIHIYSDSTAALKRLKVSTPSPGQWLIKKIAETETMIKDLGHRVEYHCIPSHMDIKGNEIADKAAKEAAAHPITQPTRRIPLQEQFTTISHLNRYAKEKRTEERRQWLQKTMAPD